MYIDVSQLEALDVMLVFLSDTGPELLPQAEDVHAALVVGACGHPEMFRTRQYRSSHDGMLLLWPLYQEKCMTIVVDRKSVV